MKKLGIFFLFLLIPLIVFTQEILPESEFSELWLNKSRYSTLVLNNFYNKTVEQLENEYGAVLKSNTSLIDNRYSEINDILYELQFKTFDIVIQYISHLDAFLVHRVKIKKAGYFPIWSIDIGSNISSVTKIFGAIPINEKLLEEFSFVFYFKNNQIDEIIVYNLE